MVKRLKNDINTNIIPVLRSFEAEYVNDSSIDISDALGFFDNIKTAYHDVGINDAYARTLEEVFDNLRRGYIGIAVEARSVSDTFVSGANNANKQRFYSAIESAIGVDLSTIIQNEGLEDILVATTRENVGLIKSIPDEYFKKIETLVFTGTTQGNTAGSMIKEIQRIGKVTAKRAKLIARDQSSKLNSALSQQRQQNLGVTEYVWRTAGDERVRDNHRSKNGRTFRWDSPPKDTGHPGQDIQCRCVAQPIINV